MKILAPRCQRLQGVLFFPSPKDDIYYNTKYLQYCLQEKKKGQKIKTFCSKIGKQFINVHINKQK